MSTQTRPTKVAQTIAIYSFVKTAGRARLISAYEELLDALGERSLQHKEHGNDELLKITANSSQSALFDLERLCRKWEEADGRGLVY